MPGCKRLLLLLPPWRKTAVFSVSCRYTAALLLSAAGTRSSSSQHLGTRGGDEKYLLFCVGGMCWASAVCKACRLSVFVAMPVGPLLLPCGLAVPRRSVRRSSVHAVDAAAATASGFTIHCLACALPVAATHIIFVRCVGGVRGDRLSCCRQMSHSVGGLAGA